MEAEAKAAYCEFRLREAGVDAFTAATTPRGTVVVDGQSVTGSDGTRRETSESKLEPNPVAADNFSIIERQVCNPRVDIMYLRFRRPE